MGDLPLRGTGAQPWTGRLELPRNLIGLPPELFDHANTSDFRAPLRKSCYRMVNCCLQFIQLLLKY